jgi:HSP20 family protein
MGNKELVPIKEKETKRIEELLETQNYISPNVNIYETENDFVLLVDMPGIPRKNVKVKLDNDLLIIFGQIDYEDKINKKYILNEVEIGNYFRSFKISESVDSSDIEAKYDDGQLVVKLPKNEKVKPRTIEIL